MRKLVYYMFLLIVNTSLYCACSSQKKELKGIVKHMQSQTISIPYNRMNLWTPDSILAISPWEKAKLKFVHYVDSATCSSCYLHKVTNYELLFNMEKVSNNEFFNLFIINPDNNTKRILESEYYDKLIPSTIFVDSANIFRKINPTIPSEMMYHTFLLDKGKKIILIGNPTKNDKIKKIFNSIVTSQINNMNSTK